MKIAITGGSGFIGRNFLRSYSDTAHVLTRGGKTTSEQRNITYYSGDLTLADYHDFLNNTSVLIHLACSLTPRFSEDKAEAEARINFDGSMRIFEQFKKLNPDGKIVFFSSGGTVYDNSTSKIKTETDPLLPTTPYGLLKVRLEQHLSELTKNSSLRTYSLRVSNPYGELFSSQRSQGFIGIALKSALENLPLKIFENQKNVRDYLHIDDLNDLLHNMIISTADTRGEHRVYNVGTGVGTSLEELVSLIEHATGRELQKIYTSQEMPVTYNVLNVEQIYKDFGWRARKSVPEGIRKALSR